MSVFRNNVSFDRKTPKQFLKQSKPNVTLYRWIPQRQFFGLIQPNEKGSFFQPGSSSSDQNKPAQQDDEQFIYSPPSGGSISGGAISQIRLSPPGTRLRTGLQPSAVTPFSNTGGGAGGSGGGSGGGGGGAGGGGGRVK